MKRALVLSCLLVSSLTLSQTKNKSDWLTEYERSNCLRTPRYAETVAYCQRLAAACPWVRYTTFGTSPEGRGLPLVILSKEKAFDPGEALKTHKAIVLIQSGIHAGEIDGKDASLMLMRDIAITKERAALLDHAIILFVPIFNVDGHERFGKFNRINQNGPEEMGWRVTAQNLNLNRDYMKADAPEMRCMLNLFAEWLPDFYVDCHVTDGIDFQYDVTYSVELYQNLDPDIVAWLKQSYIPAMTADVQKSGHGIAPYISTREDKDLSKGFTAGPATPRFSTGYGAIQNRPTLLIETHMLKPYKARVGSTYEILASTLSIVNREYQNLRKLVLLADQKVAEVPPTAYLPLRFETTGNSRPMEFKGVKSILEFSDISGSHRLVYSKEPADIVAPYFDEVRVTDSVLVPRYYFIPQAWERAVEVLKSHHVQMRSLSSSLTITVESYKFSNVRWQERPYEGRHPVTFSAEKISQERTFPEGTWVVPTSQRTGKVLMNLLEPNGPDSFVSWGFFDAIFEQKEYGEDYVLEKLAREMLDKDAGLKEEFAHRLAVDSVFAKSPSARLNFFYQRSPYWDSSVGMYPVARVMEEIPQRLLKK